MKGESNNMENKKFEKPTLIVVLFTNEDIITTSGTETYDPLSDWGDEGELE